MVWGQQDIPKRSKSYGWYKKTKHLINGDHKLVFYLYHLITLKSENCRVYWEILKRENLTFQVDYINIRPINHRQSSLSGVVDWKSQRCGTDLSFFQLINWNEKLLGLLLFLKITVFNIYFKVSYVNTRCIQSCLCWCKFI